MFSVVGVLCVITHVPYTPDRELLDILRAADMLFFQTSY